ncbi:MAG: metalloendopeptidase-like protein membrane protein [uncultured bacterium]|nr:MAG: metalloendopeptidase-like protein membrane protein [uncultured bacterium]
MNIEYRYQERRMAEERKGKIRNFLLWILVLLLISYGLFMIYDGIWGNRQDKDEIEVSLKEDDKKEEPIDIIETPKDDKAKAYVVAEGDIPADILMSHGGFNANDVVSLLTASDKVYDFANLKIGQPLRFYFENGEKASRIEYDRNTESMIVAKREEKEFKVSEEKISYEVTQEVARGKIDNFFYVDAMEAGLTEATVLEMGDIFSFSIDFTTEIQQGDEFVAVYEKRTKNGERATDGKILGAKFVNEGKSHFAYFFDNNGQGGFYDEEGRVLERQFLKAPLSYRRITSGYTGARMHPITRKVSAHYQIDYAALTGTPVVASARGSVSSAGWEGGWGNMIRLKHEGGYATHYGHLSAIAKGIKAGASVAQNQVIGYVGSTGWSTGPHLDYGMKLNGSPVNPLALNLPKGNPLNGETMKLFEEEKNKYSKLLE